MEHEQLEPQPTTTRMLIFCLLPQVVRSQICIMIDVCMVSYPYLKVQSNMSFLWFTHISLVRVFFSCSDLHNSSICILQQKESTEAI